jgi:hypothetical protein
MTANKQVSTATIEVQSEDLAAVGREPPFTEDLSTEAEE